ncbi:uncharacterized protein LOC131151966 [Malania oleifera]|uniref:uncharacterized protein LOC131151966 n=1 Tax=Malania oleifera TaxID=397392 RepID=UPI0025AE2621|nr:uncharacterized protein LOC131151966 [Malania oleifera]
MLVKLHCNAPNPTWPESPMLSLFQKLPGSESNVDGRTMAYVLPPSLFTASISKFGVRIRVSASYSRSVQMSVSASDAKSLSADPQNDAGKAETTDDLVQYVVLRRDLIDTWPLGSVITQGCHASVAAIWTHREDSHTLDYCSRENIDSMHKVTLEVKGEAQILNLSEKLTAGGILHKLWIEQPENIPTCLASKPYSKSVVSSFFRKLKLCK